MIPRQESDGAERAGASDRGARASRRIRNRRAPPPSSPGRSPTLGPVRRPLAAFVLAGAALLGVSTPAQAQASVLGSNDGQKEVTTAIVGDRVIAQGFTAGSNPSGYTLSSIEVNLARAPGNPANLTVALWSPGNTYRPGKLLHTFTNPGSLSRGRQAFTASTNTMLAANTTYFVVMEYTRTAGETTPRLSVTTSHKEDAGAAAGWSIADSPLFRTRGTTDGWWGTGNPIRIRVNGSEVIRTARQGSTPAAAGRLPHRQRGASEETAKERMYRADVEIAASLEAAARQWTTTNAGSVARLAYALASVDDRAPFEMDVAREVRHRALRRAARDEPRRIAPRGDDPLVSARQQGDDGPGGPTVSGVSFSSMPPAGQNGFYKQGDTISAEVVFSEAVNVTGAPTLDLVIGANTRQATYRGGAGATTLTFQYTVADDDEDTDGAAIAANGLTVPTGASIRSTGGTDAVLTHTAVAADSAHKVDGVAPTITLVQIPSNRGNVETFTDNGTFQVSMQFSEPLVFAGGNPSLGLTVGTRTRTAAFFIYIAGTRVVVFSYTIVAGDYDPDGIAVPANGISLPSGATLKDAAGNDAVLDHPAAQGRAENQILGSTATPMLSIADVTTAEDAGSMTFTVSRTGSTDFDAEVHYATSNGTATAGEDYTAVSSTLTIPAGQTSATFTVTIRDDTDIEPDETFTVTLTSPANAQIARATATGTIEDDDLPHVAVSFDATTYEVSEGGTAEVTVRLDIAPRREVTIPLESEGQNGATSGDWSLPANVTFAADETSKTVTFTATDDSADDDGETVRLTFGATLPEKVSEGTPAATTVAILDNDNETVTIAARAEQVDEGSPAVFDLTRTGGTAVALSVNLSLTYHTKIFTEHATIPTSLFLQTTTESRSVTFAAGSSGAEFSLPSINDEFNEGDGEITAEIAAGANYQAGDTARSASMLVRDDDIPILTATTDKTEMFEGDFFTQRVARSAYSETLLSYDYISTVLERYLPPDQDVRSVSDSRIHTVTGGLLVGVIESVYENRYYTPTRVGPLGVRRTFELLPFDETRFPFQPRYTLGEAKSYQVEINNSRPTVTIAVAGDVSSVGEGTTVAFEITRHDGYGLAASQDLKIVLDVEQTGDYLDTTAGQRTITIPGYIEFAGTVASTTYTLSLPTVDDDVHEADGALKVSIADQPAGAVNEVGTLRTYTPKADAREASVTVTDNDPQPHFVINPAQVLESVGDAVIPVTLLNPASEEITVQWRTTGKPAGDTDATGADEAVAGTHYTASSGTLTFAPPQTQQTVSIPIIDNDLAETGKVFYVELHTPTGPALLPVPPRFFVFIQEDDVSPLLSIEPASASENAGSLEFTVEMSRTHSQNATFDWRIEYDTASAADFTSAPTGTTTATISAGQTQAAISLALVDDALDEVDETLLIVLESPSSNAVLDLGKSEAVGTIVDNDPEPTLTVTVADVAEDAGPLRFTASLSAPSGKDVTFQYETIESGETDAASRGTAAPTDDYTPTAAAITITAGSTADLVIEVPVVVDDVHERDETVALRVFGVGNAQLASGSNIVTGTITNDDQAKVSIERSTNFQGGVVNEGAQLWFVVRRETAVVADPLTVRFTLEDNGNYLPTDGQTCTVTILANERVVATTSAVGCSQVTTEDSTDEPDGAVTATLVAPTDDSYGIDGARATAAYTIRDNDDPPVLSIGDVEAEESAGALTFTVGLSAASDYPVSVSYATADGTAEAPADYTAASDALTFDPGETSKQIVVTLVADTADEADTETFTMTLSSATHATLPTPPTATGTIKDDDRPTVSVEAVDATVPEGTDAVFKLTRSGYLGVRDSFFVAIAATGKHVKNPASDLGPAREFSIGANDDHVLITIPTDDDTRDEDDGTLTATLNDSNAYLVGAREATITIQDDDPEPALSFVNATGSETAGEVEFTVNLSAASDREVTVDYSVVSWSAALEIDFEDIAGTLTFAPGTTSRMFAVPVVDDDSDEDREQFLARLANPVNATLPNPEATGFIDDNDDPPLLGVQGASPPEGDPATFEVTLTPASGKTVTVQYRTSDGPADTAAQAAVDGEDYTAVTGTLTFDPGEASKDVAVATVEDTVNEATERFRLTIHSPSNARLPAAPFADGLIVDDDAEPALSIADVTAGEADGEMVFTVTLSPASGRQVEASWATVADTATEGVDFTAGSGALTFAVGETSKEIRVALLSDQIQEDSESFHVDLTLGDSPGANLARARATGTITDDDLPVVTVATAQARLFEGGEATFTVTRANHAAKDLVVGLEITATSFLAGGADLARQVTFAADESEKALVISTDDDEIDEPDGRLEVTVNPQEAYRAGTPASASLEMLDNDVAGITVTIELDPGASVDEDEGDIGITYTAATAGSVRPDRDITFSIRTESDNASAGADYTALSEIIHIRTGDFTLTANGNRYTASVNQNVREQALSITIREDTEDEPDETFRIKTERTAGSFQVEPPADLTITILDNDEPPGKPVLSGTVGDAQVTLNWTAPDAGTSIITSYEYRRSADGGTTWPPDWTDVGDVITYTVTGLANGVAHTFEVRARNVVGPGPASEALTLMTTIPSVTGVSFTSSPPAGQSGTYKLGDTITLEVVFSEPVDVTGTPTLDLTVGSDTAAAGYTGGTGTDTLTFAYTVQADDVDRDGAGVSANGLKLAGGTIRKQDSTTQDANLALAALASQSGQQVDGAAPALRTATVSGDQLVLTWDEALNSGAAPAASAFALGYTGTGTTPTIGGVAVSGTVVTLTLSRATTREDTLTISYTAPSGASALQDLAGNPAADFTDQAVTNQSVPTVTVTFDAAAYTVTEGADVEVTVTLSADPERGVTIPIVATPGDGASAADYTVADTVTFASGEMSKVLTFGATGDTEDDDDETVALSFGTLPFAVTEGARPAATVAITDDDDPVVTVSFGAADYRVAEGADVEVTVTLSADPERSVEIPLTATPGTGAEATEFTAPESVSFASGEISKTVPFTTTEDTADEEDETVELGFGATLPAGVSAGAPATTTVTITDDDSAPGAPALTAAPADGKVTLTWTAPADPGSSAITSYEYRVSADGKTTWSPDWTDAGNVFEKEISSLTNGTEYTFQVRAVNAVGKGETAETAATPVANNAPRFTSAAAPSVAENTTAVLTVAATDDDADDDVTGYALQGGADQSKFTFDPSTRELVFVSAPNFEDLQDADRDGAYVVIVRATSGTGDRQRTTDQTITVTVTDVDEQPATPGAPTVDPASGATTSLDVRWTAPGRNGGPALTGYKVQYRVSGESAWTDWTHAGTGTTATVTELTASTSYEVRVRALNGETPSEWSTPGTGSTGNSPPAFDEGARATREVAENTGAGADIGDAVTATDTGTDDALTYTLEGADASSFDIVSTSGQLRTKSGVTYDHEAKSSYTVTVKVTDSESATATIMVTITVTDVAEAPGKPAAPTFSGTTSTTLAVTWTAPENTGPDITDYDVRYRTGSDTFAGWTHDGTATTATITGLAASTAYDVQVRARNAEGDGAWSDSGTGTTAAPPIIATAGIAAGASVTEGTALAFTLTVDPLPAATTSYTATLSVIETGGDMLEAATEGAKRFGFQYNPTTSAYEAPATALSGTDVLSGSANVLSLPTAGDAADELDSTVTVSITAVTGFLNSDDSVVSVNVGTPASAFQTVTDDDELPGKPVISSAAPGNAQVTLTWTAPTQAGTSRVTGYDYRYKADGDAAFGGWTDAGAGATATVDGLTNGAEYTFEVRAKSAAGDGPASDPIAATPTEASATVPAVSEVSFTSTPAAGQNDTYKLSDVIEVEVAFSEAVDVTGTPTVDLTIGDATRQATYTGGHGTATLTFEYVVVAGDEDSDGAGIAANGLKLPGPSDKIRKKDGTQDANRDHAAKADQAAHKVDGIVPELVVLSIAEGSESSVGQDRIYSAGDSILFVTLFSEDVVVEGNPSIEFMLGGQSRQAPHHGTVKVFDVLDGEEFRYVVVAGDLDTDGVSVAANPMRPNGGRIRDVAGNGAVLDHKGFADDEGHKVYGVRVTTTVVLPDGPVGGPFDARVAFSHDVTGFVDSDITVGNGAVTAFVATNAREYVATIMPAASGQVSVSVAADVAHYASNTGNGNRASETATVTADLRPAPEVSIKDATASEADRFMSFTVSLSAASSFEVSVAYETSDGTATAGADYTATQGTLTILAGETSGTIEVPILQDDVYEFERNRRAEDEVFQVTLTSAQQAVLGRAQATGTIEDDEADEVALTIVVHVWDRNEDGSVDRGPFDVLFAFHQPGCEVCGIAVDGFSLDDITVTGGTKGSSLRTSYEGAAHTLEITPDSGAAEVVLSVAAGVATVKVGEVMNERIANKAATLSVPFLTSARAREALTVEITGPEGPVRERFEARFAFNREVTGFTWEDVEVGNGALSDETLARVDGATYTAEIEPAAGFEGTVTVAVPAEAARDGDGAGNLASQPLRIAADLLAPTVEVTSEAEAPVSGEFPVVVRFSEPVSGFRKSELAIGNGHATRMLSIRKVAHTVYVVPNPGASGALSITVPAGVATDVAGNPNAASEPFTISLPARGPVTGFTLFDPASGEAVRALAEGTVLEGLSLDRLNVRAEIAPDEQIGSMRLELTGAQIAARTADVVPYALFGDKGGQAFPVGEYRITATPYPEPNLGGTPGPTRTMAFTVAAGQDAEPSGARAPGPTVSSVAITSLPESGGAYAPGEKIEVTVQFETPVTVDTTNGTPSIGITVGGTARQATYASGTGTARLMFTYTATTADRDTGAVGLVANSLSLNGGTIRVVAGTDPARPRLLIADARVREAADAVLEFQVTLRPASADPVTVAYETADGTATAGEDYTAASGTVTFAPGETEQTIAVTVLDDAHDEGEETVTLRLSDATGATLTDAEAVGTIVNSDPLPQVWLARFGRTVATHVVDAVGERLRGSPGSYVTVGGRRMSLKSGSAGAPGAGLGETRLPLGVGALGSTEPGTGGWGPAPGNGWPWAERRAGASRTLTGRDLLVGSAFRLTLGADDDGRAGTRWTAWGRVAATRFDGVDSTLSLEGDVLTGTLGVDGEWDRWLAGVAVAHSRGDGSYTVTAGAGDRGELENSLTSVHPYLRYQMTERLDVWGLLGYGWGDLTLEQANAQAALETDTDLVMGAFGGRGVLLPAGENDGFELTARSEAMLTRMTSDAVNTGASKLESAEADAHRLRLVLKGSREFELSAGRMLAPSVELGLRHDWGDAETGFGLELGGRARYADPALGLTIEGGVRGLLAHEDSDYEEWGAWGSVRVDPGTAGHGLSLTLTPTWGAASSGVEGLWSRQHTAGLGANDQRTPGGRLEAEVGYGLEAPGNSGLLTPYAGMALSEEDARTWRLGTRFSLGTAFGLSLEGDRRESANTAPAHGVMLRGELRW